MKDKFTSVLQEDENGDLILEFPADILNQMGWTEDTLLEWEISEKGAIIREKDHA